MSSRVSRKLLARPSGHSSSSGTASRSRAPVSSSSHGSNGPSPSPPSPPTASSSMAPLLQFPAFHPIPFQQDKFLSIKTRSLETYTKLRGDVLQRCTDLRAQLQRNSERAERLSGSYSGEAAGVSAASTAPSLSTSSSVTDQTAATTKAEHPLLPLTPHQAEELLLLSKKVESLVDYQGFVLTDELVWRVFHLCVQCGAPQLAIHTWLRKRIITEKRGPPFPLFLLHDLAELLRATVLARLPESGAGLSCSASILLSASARGEAALQDAVVAAQRCLLSGAFHRAEQSAAPTAASDPAQLYVARVVEETLWPVWVALRQMGLTFAELDKRNEMDEDREGEAEDWVEGEVHGDAASAEETDTTASLLASPKGAMKLLPSAAEQTAAVRATLMSVTPLYSFHPPPSPSPPRNADGNAQETSNSAAADAAKTAATRAHALLHCEPPSFPSAVDAVVSPLRALLDVWLLVAQCASEAKDTRLLQEVQRAICLGFLTASAAASDGVSADNEAVTESQRVCVNEAAWCRYTPPPTLSSSSSPASPVAAREQSCQHAAEEEAQVMVRTFLNGALSVTQYGLLCAEQEAALWQLHDSFALVAGAAALLHRLRNADASTAALPLCMKALAEAGHRSTDAEVYHLLCEALPRALQATTADHCSREAPMVENVRAMVAQSLQSGTTAAGVVGEGCTAAVPVYAEAGLYVGLASGDDAMLDSAASAMSLPASEAALLRWNAQALQAHRCAVQWLIRADTDGASPSSSPASSPPLPAWEALVQVWERTRQSSGEHAPATEETAPLSLDGFLQSLLLDTACRQARGAAAFVEAVHSGSSGSASTSDSVEEGAGAERHEEAEEASHSNSAEAAEEERQAVAEQAWVQLHKDSLENVQECLARLAVFLTESAASSSASASTHTSPCLSPSALSSLALLARMGMYAEEGADPSAAGTSLSSSLSVLLSRLREDTCAALQHGSSSSVSSSAVTGTWVQWVLVTLMHRRDWAGVLAVLQALESRGHNATSDATTALLCSTTVDPSVFAALYACAMEDGAASVCAFLRPRREALFF